MKKILTFFLCATIILIPVNAIAAAKPGATCSKLGVTSTVGGKKYTCIKSGKKLVWDKGALIPVKVAPASLNEASIDYGQVPYWAFKKSAEVINKSTVKSLNYKVLIGPNTRPINEIPQIALGLVSKMFPHYDFNREFVLIYFNFTDQQWAQEKFIQYIGNSGGYDTSNEVVKVCSSVLNCNSAAQVSNHDNGMAVLLISASESSKNDRHFYSGTMEAHEFFHAYQNTLFFGLNRASNQLPRWLLEGSASFVELASIYSNDFNAYLTNKGNLLVQLHYQKAFKENDLIKFLDAPSLGTDWSSWDSYNPQRVYDIGMLATEIMVAAKGPECILEQYKLVANGMSYKEAFQKVFGVSWDEGVKLLAKAIAKETS